MGNKLKKSLAVLTVSALALSLTGCGSSGSNNGGTNSASANTGSTNSGQAASSNNGGSADQAVKQETFTFFSEDPSPNWNNMQDEIGKVLTEKTGVTIKAEFAVGDPSQKVGLIASSGQYPDLISAKADLGKMVDAGAMIDLRPLIDKYGPHIKALYGDYFNRLRYDSKSDAIYFLPTYSGVNQSSFDAGGGFELQHRVVQELGYPKLQTVQDYENAIEAYIKKHPTTDGKPTIGVSLNADDWHMYISVTNPAFLSTGAPDDGEYNIDPNTYEAKYHYLRPEEKDYFKWLNHMNDIGLLDPESFVQKYDQYTAKVASGRVLGLIDQNWDYNSGEQALKAAGKFDEGYGHYPIQLTTDTKDHSFQSTGFEPGYGIGITTACKDPVAAIKFFDYLASEEGQVLINWGVEGKDYKVENGKRVIPADVNNRKVNDAANFAKETGIGLYIDMAPHYGDGVKDSTGNYYTTSFPDQIVAGYNNVEKDVLKHYNATTWKDLFPSEKEFPVKPWGAAFAIQKSSDSDLVVLENKMKDITWSYIPKIVLAKPADFDKLWDEYMGKLKGADVDKMDQEETQLIKDRLALWGTGSAAK